MLSQLKRQRPSKSDHPGSVGLERLPSGQSSWALAEDNSAFPCIHTGQLSAICNSSSRGSTALFWSPRAPTDIDTDIHIPQRRSLKKWGSLRSYATATGSQSFVLFCFSRNIKQGSDKTISSSRILHTPFGLPQWPSFLSAAKIHDKFMKTVKSN